MKARNLKIVALAAILGVTFASSNIVLADDTGTATEMDSNGKVTVVEGTGGEIPDPEEPEKELPEDKEQIPTNPVAGALSIRRVSHLNFGTIKTSSNDVIKHAAPVTIPKSTKTRGAIVGWTDVRAGGTYGYTINAKLTQQFTGEKSSENVLTGSIIDYSNGMMVTSKDNTNTQPSKVTGAFTLEYGTAVEVVNADKTKKEGKGAYALEFGQSGDYTGNGGTKDTAGTSVQLTVPRATASNMALDDYTAKVTWTIVAGEQ